MCKRYKIDNSRRVKHTAIIDCELLSKVYVNLAEQKEPTFDLKILITAKFSETTNSKIKYCKKVIKPTQEEVKLHKDFLKSSLKKLFLIKFFIK